MDSFIFPNLIQLRLTFMGNEKPARVSASLAVIWKSKTKASSEKMNV